MRLFEIVQVRVDGSGRDYERRAFSNFDNTRSSELVLGDPESVFEQNSFDLAPTSPDDFATQ